jgi:hypothetical protein
MARSCRLALLGLAMSTLGATRAPADELQPVRVVYRAPAECPTREEFEARVLARTGKDGLYPEDGASFERFEIELLRSAGRTRGRLTTHLRGAEPTVREIQAASCHEAADGLALIVALTLDPTSTSKPSPTPADTDRGVTRDERRADEPTTDTDEDGDEDSLADGGARLDSGWSGGRARFDVLVAASLLPEGGLSLGAVFPSLLEPGLMVRLGARFAPDRTTVTAQGDATFSLWTAHAALCPQIFELSRLWLAPCANLEYGKVAASGSRTQNGASSRRDWLALGPKLLGELSLFGPLFVHLGGTLAFPLFRDTYVLGPLEVHETPPVIGRLELGLGARL